jgi:transposase-like protein
MGDDDFRECLNKCGSQYYAEHHFTEPQVIACKWCGSTEVSKYGVRDGVQEYICNSCGRKFNTKDAPYKKQASVDQIGAVLDMYYSGLSFAKVARIAGETYDNPVDESTVYRWVMEYTEKAVRAFDCFRPVVSDTWIADETVLGLAGKNVWLYDIIDHDTRFLLATRMTWSRRTIDAQHLMESAASRAGKAPRIIITDKNNSYLDGIEIAFGADTEHIQSKGFTIQPNTNLVERFHGTLKDRTKVMRDFKTWETALLIVDGFLVHYNFFRPHMSLGEQRPAEVAEIDYEIKTWIEFVRSDR